MGKGMKAGKRPSAGGAKGMQRQQMAQIQAMQQMMEKTQAEIEAKEVEASAGGGAVPPPVPSSAPPALQSCRLQTP